jgi:RimJ/RimL family protein N-acetyltransferase
MFTINNVTLRYLEFDDIETLYSWETDIELSIWSGWTPPLSRAAFRHKYERRITEPEKDLVMLGIEFEGQLVGYVQLALIDDHERRAAVGIVVGEKRTWGRGIGRTALRILLDYAFTVRNLERVYAEVYGFNQRSLRLMEHVGFQKEGILRQHEIHNGTRQDMHFFGMLNTEFYQKYETIFKLHVDVNDENEAGKMQVSDYADE